MIVGIIGSRRRNSSDDTRILERTFVDIVTKELGIKFDGKDVTIVTGDCDEGGDFLALYLASIYRCILDIKRIKDPETGEEMNFNHHRWFPYREMVQIFYNRNEEIAKEPLDYLLALVAPDRTGGTENTIRYFKRYHKDWKKKLILIK